MAHAARLLTCAAAAALLAACATPGSSVPAPTPADQAWRLTRLVVERLAAATD